MHVGVWFLFLWLFHCMRGLPGERETKIQKVLERGHKDTVVFVLVPAGRGTSRELVSPNRSIRNFLF
ncbi:hypothetical protein PDJAM_G00199480 [Pangasius djambal]|uniref:Uncharacterized protein n=1 Tax=Pangasius djambal TaxID=1691987 RepID=A0ACC5Y6N0_9TELE|nr:hypothetical protein [Pangasius djambal]